MRRAMLLGNGLAIAAAAAQLVMIDTFNRPREERRQQRSRVKSQPKRQKRRDDERTGKEFRIKGLRP